MSRLGLFSKLPMVCMSLYPLFALTPLWETGESGTRRAPLRSLQSTLLHMISSAGTGRATGLASHLVVDAAGFVDYCSTQLHGHYGTGDISVLLQLMLVVWKPNL